MSVFSAISRPSRFALNGVFGAGLSTTVLPLPSAWPSLLRVTSNGKFHGTIAPTTPTGSRHTLMVVFAPVRLMTLSPRSVSQAYESISRAGYFSPSASGASSWGPKVMARGVPTSRISSSRSSSISDSIASCSCSRQRLRSSLLVDQSVSSNARRAASMARCMSSVGRVRNLAERLLGRRVDVREGAGLAFDQLAVDHHLRLEADLYSVSHMCSALFGRGAAQSAGTWNGHPQRGHPTESLTGN